jgi:hypothetical protein
VASPRILLPPLAALRLCRRCQRFATRRRRCPRASTSVRAGAAVPAAAVRVWLRSTASATAGSVLRGCAVQLQPSAAAVAEPSVRLRESESEQSVASPAVRSCTTECWVPATECRVPATKCWVHATECWVPATECWVHETECWVPALGDAGAPKARRVQTRVAICAEAATAPSW